MSTIINFPFSSNGENSPFDKIKHIDESGAEYWIARELMPLLGYAKWENFESVIEKAQSGCVNSGQDPEQHFFLEPGKSPGKSVKGRPSEDFKLTRYASYMIAMNGDSRKPQIASAQSYFAVRTEQAEQIENIGRTGSFTLDFATSMLQQMRQNHQVLSILLENQKQTQQRLHSVEEKVAGLVEVQQQAKLELQKIDFPEVPAREMSDRIKVSWLVDTYARKTSVSHREIWAEVYREFNYRYSLNIGQRASNATKKLEEQGKKTRVSKIDIVQQLNLCKELYAVAYELLINQAS